MKPEIKQYGRYLAKYKGKEVRVQAIAFNKQWIFVGMSPERRYGERDLVIIEEI